MLLRQLIDGKPVRRTPIWLMRQAGRYLPEYRAVKEKKTFLEMCHDPDLIYEITMQPMRRFDLDAAIIFSDILILAEAMGVSVDFHPEPQIREPICDASRVSALRTHKIQDRTGFLLEAIENVRQGLPEEKALLGFAGAPFTVAAYMVEGKGSKDFVEVKRLMYRNKTVFRELLARIGEAVVPFLKAQIEAGCDLVQIFDSWASVLCFDDYCEFALEGVRPVIAALKAQGTPVIYYINGGAPYLSVLKDTGADVISIDHRTDPKHALKALDGLVLQGNLDPAVLLAQEAVIREKARKTMEAFKGARGHIFNLGHGVLKETSIEAVQWLVDEVHRAQYAST
jgi:uroporphyrinogen decarboxylase